MGMPTPVWQVTDTVFGFAFVMWGIVFTGQELIWLLMRYGEYAGCTRGRRIKRFLIRLAENLATGFAVMFVASLIANLIYGPRP